MYYYTMKTICDWNNCFETGEYRAPIERDNSKNFRLLCLKHVKEFNRNWNYFAGMNDNEVIELRLKQSTGEGKYQLNVPGTGTNPDYMEECRADP